MLTLNLINLKKTKFKNLPMTMHQKICLNYIFQVTHSLVQNPDQWEGNKNAKFQYLNCFEWLQKKTIKYFFVLCIN